MRCAVARSSRMNFAKSSGDVTARWIWQVIELTFATLRGSIRSRLMTDPRGFDAIDDYDCREWLLANGASQNAVDSGFLRALYDLGQTGGSETIMVAVPSLSFGSSCGCSYSITTSPSMRCLTLPEPRTCSSALTHCSP